EDDDKGNDNLNRTAQQRPDNAPAGNEERHEEAPSPSGKNGRALRKPVELLQDLLPRHFIVVAGHPPAASRRTIGHSIASFVTVGLSQSGCPNRAASGG